MNSVEIEKTKGYRSLLNKLKILEEAWKTKWKYGKPKRWLLYGEPSQSSKDVSMFISVAFEGQTSTSTW